ncbi:MAG: precorrin-6Y C5,15-methyltransferase (decarboxylating) subunit CbiT, partial [Epulopiscium sp. Nuni2H_MBin003]
QFSSLSTVIIINEKYDNTQRFGIPDDEFIRVDKVPMTKSEVRAITLSKLQLNNNSIIYDIGAGTGSVSIELALNAPDGKVYAIEQNENAITAIGENKLIFQADNIEIIHGMAPEAMKDLPAPTHVFVGGSLGKLSYIIADALKKNVNTRFVVNCVTMETVNEVMEIIKEFKFTEIVQVNVSKSKKLGNYNLLVANNPVFIITFSGQK